MFLSNVTNVKKATFKGAISEKRIGEIKINIVRQIWRFNSLKIDGNIIKIPEIYKIDKCMRNGLSRARNIHHTEISAGRPCKITFVVVAQQYIRITNQWLTPPSHLSKLSMF